MMHEKVMKLPQINILMYMKEMRILVFMLFIDVIKKKTYQTKHLLCLPLTDFEFLGESTEKKKNHKELYIM